MFSTCFDFTLHVTYQVCGSTRSEVKCSKVYSYSCTADIAVNTCHTLLSLTYKYIVSGRSKYTYNRVYFVWKNV